MLDERGTIAPISYIDMPYSTCREVDCGMAALGLPYVMEGSTLGGRGIQKNVERRLGDEGRASCSYFNGYGKQIGPMWRAFLTRLDAPPPADSERMGWGATATFEQLGWWLTRPA